MEFCIKIGRSKKTEVEEGPKPEPEREKPTERFFIEMYNGKPYCVVTEKNMYSEGYMGFGWVDGIKQWTLSDEYISNHERVFVAVSQGIRTKRRLFIQ